MASAKIFRINYKSDFILTLTSDAGWMTPFCIKFWTGAPSQAYYVGWDGETYNHCSFDPSEPTKLQVQFDDHHLPIGDLKYQVAYHFTVADFPNDTEDEVINPANITTEIDGETYHVMLDFTGETAPEIQFSLPAYANEAQRIENEQQRIANEQQRIDNEQERIDNEQTRQLNEETRIENEQERVQEFGQMKGDLEQATRDAAAAAENAYEKGVYAKNQGDYAKQQGDYAKQQGDIAKADHERAEDDHRIAGEDHTQAGSDHTRAGEDHTQAGSDHTRAGEDHTRAGEDHTRADQDHTRAESDHAAVEVYVDSLGAFDISAYHATGGVLTKYADLTAALGTNGANIPDTLRKGGMSVKFVQSSDNNYVQYRLTNQNWSTVVTDWQGVDTEIISDSKNIAESGAVASGLISIDKKIEGLTYKNKVSEQTDGSLAFQIFDFGLSFFTIQINKKFGNLSQYSVRLMQNGGSQMITLKGGCSFGVKYTFQYADIATYPNLLIYQASAGTTIQNTDYEISIWDESDNSTLRKEDICTDKAVGLDVKDIASEEKYGGISKFYELPSKDILVNIDKLVGNLTGYSIRLANASEEQTSVLMYGAEFGKTYKFENIDLSENKYLFIYQGSSVTTLKDTKYLVTVTSLGDNVLTRLNTVEGNVDKNTEDITEHEEIINDDIFGTLAQVKAAEQSDGSLSIFVNPLTSSNIRVKIDKIRGNQQYYSVRIQSADSSSTIILQSGCVYGKTYDFYNINISDYPQLFIFQLSAGTTIQNTEYILNVEDISKNNLETHIRLSEKSIGLEDKKILMLGDSITQLPYNNGVWDKNGIVEYFSQKTGAEVIRGAFGGTHMAARLDLTGITTITTINQAYAALDIVNIVKAIVTNNFDLQDQAVTYLQSETFSRILANIKAVALDKLDIITVFAGTNDCNSSVGIGDDNSTNDMEYAGAINLIVDYLCTANKKLKVYFFTPIVRWWPTNNTMDWTNTAQWSDNRANGGGAGVGLHLYDYAEAVLRVSKKNHLPACDLYYGLGWNIYNYKNFCENNDGTHPVKGFDVIANKMVSFMMANQ